MIERYRSLTVVVDRSLLTDLLYRFASFFLYYALSFVKETLSVDSMGNSATLEDSVCPFVEFLGHSKSPCTFPSKIPDQGQRMRSSPPPPTHLKRLAMVLHNDNSSFSIPEEATSWPIPHHFTQRVGLSTWE